MSRENLMHTVISVSLKNIFSGNVLLIFVIFMISDITSIRIGLNYHVLMLQQLKYHRIYLPDDLHG